MKRPPELEQFIRERDEMLLKLDVAAARAFALKWNGPPKYEISEAAQLAGIHKARAAATTLPESARRFSVKWLTERGLSHEAPELA